MFLIRCIQFEVCDLYGKKDIDVQEIKVKKIHFRIHFPFSHGPQLLFPQTLYNLKGIIFSFTLIMVISVYTRKLIQ